MAKNKQSLTPEIPKPSVARLKAGRMGAEFNKAIGKATALAATAGGGVELLIAPEYANNPLKIALGVVAVGAATVFARENRRSRRLSDEITNRQSRYNQQKAQQDIQNAATDRLGIIRGQLDAEKKSAESTPAEPSAKKQRNWLMRKLFGEKPDVGETAPQASPGPERQTLPAQQLGRLLQPAKAASVKSVQPTAWVKTFQRSIISGSFRRLILMPRRRHLLPSLSSLLQTTSSTAAKPSMP